jgi:hypothetical protein
VKIVLIVLAIIVGLAILAGAGMTFFAWKLARSVKVSTRGDEVSINSPFGKVETSKDAAEIAKRLGVDVYPGAMAIEGSGAVTIGNLKTATAIFESGDTPAKIADFYKARFPRHQIAAENEEQHTLLVASGGSMITIQIEPAGRRTRITISQVEGRNLPSSPATSTN